MNDEVTRESGELVGNIGNGLMKAMLSQSMVSLVLRQQWRREQQRGNGE